MRVLLLLRGSAGCGKSTWIEQNGLKPYTLSADDIRLLCQSPVLQTDGTVGISQSNDKIVWKTLFDLLEIRMQKGEFTVIDATNSKTSEMNRYKQMCDIYRYRMYCVDFTDIPIEEVKKRNASREELKRVPDEVIDKMYSRFKTQKIPSGIKVIKPNELDTIWMKLVDLSGYKKIHHIGDIHGCYTALKKYLDNNGGIKDDEFYIFCGDYVDRGIENADVVNYLISIKDKKNVLMLEGNHECYHKDTEVLTDKGWKLLKDVNIENDLVAEFNINNNIIDFVKPLRKISKTSNELVIIEGFDTKQVVTMNHDVVYGNEKIKANEFLNKDKLTQQKFSLFGYANDKAYDIDDNSLKLLVWVITDGTIVDYRKSESESNKRRIQWKLSREDKIKSLTNLLNNMGIEYTIKPVGNKREGRKQPYIIRVYGDTARFYCDKMLDGVKHYPSFFRNLNRRQALIVLEELVKTDASSRSEIKIDWSCIDKNDVDIIQEMCIKNGIACTYRLKDNSCGYNKNGTIYWVSFKPYGVFTNNQIKVEKINYNDKVYCLTMPQGTLITRIDGKVAFSGNCHIWRWANNCQSRSKEFELVTKPQLENAKIDKKDVRQLYRKFGQCAYYKYGENVYLVTHAGLSVLPENLTFVATEQMIKGVGSYNDFEKIADTFVEKMPSNYYQIHGHRNTKQVPIRVNDRVFNLEGRVEFGGDLRCVQLDKNGMHEVETHNEVFKTPEMRETQSVTNSSVSDIIIALRANKYIKEKNFGNISSFNFTSKAFYDKVWNEQTTKARGLYLDTIKGKVVARAYEKFFNINERPETKFDMLQNRLQFPVTAYVKENGYLGIVSYDEYNDSLFIASKSTIDSQFAEWLKEAIYEQITPENREKMKQFAKDNNVSFVFENVDMKNDPHIIEYSESKLYLLDIVYNQMDFAKYDYETMCDIAHQFGLTPKEKALEIANWQDFYDWYYAVLEEDYEYNGRKIEGFVIEDSVGYMTKLKLAYYNFWKFMRAVSHEAIKNGYIKKTSALTTPIANEYYAWVRKLHDVEDIESVPRDICTLRKQFFKDKLGE